MSILSSGGAALIAFVWGFGASLPPDVSALLPKPAGWAMTEEAQRFLPDSLFEYINGAAESYLAYDFRELAVGQYQAEKGEAAMTVEIYDMGSPRNAFGIYGTERYPESRFLDLGVQGYIEEGALNFLAGRYYVKLLCYEAGGAEAESLKAFAGEILKGVGDPGEFPPELRAFPPEGRVANSEKFLLSNVLGFKFLSQGFLASYKTSQQDFEAFLVVGRSSDEAASLLAQTVAQLSKTGAQPVSTETGIRIKDPYLDTVILARSGSYLCGVTKIKDGGEAEGEKVVAAMTRSLNARTE
ncbi:MAG: hypothetical protein FJY82_05875 [Candidatus Aminicenantes bacterium]|nr:hypothetical protein [Candidatus Aminicenantes bacterium]